MSPDKNRNDRATRATLKRGMAVALLLPFSTFAVQWLLWDVLQPLAWFLFYPAVYATALFGGLWSGIGGTLISAALVWYFFIPTPYSFHLENPYSLVSIGLFVGIGVVFSLFHERQRKLLRMEERGGSESAESLRETEELLLIAQEGAQVGVWSWDIANNTNYWSPECEKLYGLAPGSLKSNDDWRTRVHPGDLQLIDAQWEINILNGKPFEVEYRFRLDSGETRWLVSKGYAQYDADGKPIRLSGINIDITERRKTVEALRSSEDRYRTAFQTSLDAININRLSDGLYIDVNQAFLDIMGYERNEVIGLTSEALNIWTNPLSRIQLVEDLKRNSACHNMEACFNNKRGEHVWGLMSASIMNLDGVPCILSITRDITNRKRTDQQLHLAASVFTFAREGIMITADDGTIVEVNDAFTRITGYSRDEVLAGW